jgi:hypothetical protein
MDHCFIKTLLILTDFYGNKIFCSFIEVSFINHFSPLRQIPIVLLYIKSVLFFTDLIYFEKYLIRL